MHAPWNRARVLLEDGNVTEAHDVLVSAIDQELKDLKQTEKREVFNLPLLVLELGKSFLKQNESQDALSAFEQAVAMFEEYFFEGLGDKVAHERYVEAMLHLAKVLYLSGQGNPEHVWKKAAAHCMRQLGRERYELIVASNGLAELYLEQLRLADAERCAEAALELSGALAPATRETRRRGVESMAMLGVARAQQQDWTGAAKRYLQALEELEKLQQEEETREGPGLDAWTRTAYQNLYRNLEHMARGKGSDEEAAAWKEKSFARLGRLETMVLDDAQASSATSLESLLKAVARNQ